MILNFGRSGRRSDHRCIVVEGSKVKGRMAKRRVTVISVTNTDITTGTVWGLMLPNDARFSSESVIVRNG